MTEPSSDAWWAAFAERWRARGIPASQMPPGYLTRGMRLPTVTEFLALEAQGATTAQCEECRTKSPLERTCPHPR